MKNGILFTIVALFIKLHAIAQIPKEQLQELIGTWTVIESSFTDPPEGTVVVTSVANGQAIYSTWTQGSNETYYEANALWSYSESTKRVGVFEVNTLGVADTHIGSFDDSGTLIIELRDPETHELLQQRSMTWTNNTWKLIARFVDNGKEIDHYATLVRQKSNKVDLAKEVEQIRNVWTKTSEYGMKSDWENYSKYFDQTGKLQMIHPGMGEWLNGWNEFSEKYEDMMKKGIKYSIIKNDISINVSNSAEMAWGLVDFVFSFNSDPDNKYQMWESVVFEKMDGEWKIVMGMATNAPDEE